MTDELKPCPFCGGVATIETRGTTGVYWIRCFECEALTCCTDKEHAIEAWNTRAERTCECVEHDGYSFRFECSACGYVALVHNCAVRLDELPTYCPNCGAKVVDASTD